MLGRPLLGRRLRGPASGQQEIRGLHAWDRVLPAGCGRRLSRARSAAEAEEHSEGECRT